MLSGFLSYTRILLVALDRLLITICKKNSQTEVNNNIRNYKIFNSQTGVSSLLLYLKHIVKRGKISQNRLGIIICLNLNQLDTKGA